MEECTPQHPSWSTHVGHPPLIVGSGGEDHGGMLRSGKNGGTVPVRACRLHAVEWKRYWIRQPARPLTPHPLLGGGDRRAVASRNAAVLACNGRSRQFHTAQHLQARHGCKVVWLNCGKPRLGRSTQGADIRLPGSFAAWAKIRGRCTWFRQCRQARDTDPSLPEPSSACIPILGIMSRTIFTSPASDLPPVPHPPSGHLLPSGDGRRRYPSRPSPALFAGEGAQWADEGRVAGIPARPWPMRGHAAAPSRPILR